jgi:hypothetical protein
MDTATAQVAIDEQGALAGPCVDPCQRQRQRGLAFAGSGRGDHDDATRIAWGPARTALGLVDPHANPPDRFGKAAEG